MGKQDGLEKEYQFPSQWAEFIVLNQTFFSFLEDLKCVTEAHQEIKVGHYEFYY